MNGNDESDKLDSSTPEPVPIMEKEALIKRLENVPEEVLRNILTNQVDLEIRLKHKELKLTEEEIGKCEAQMLALRKFFEVPNELSFRNEPNDFTLKYFEILNKSLSVNYTKLQQLQYAKEHPVFKENMFADGEPAAHSYRTRSTTSSLRPSTGGPAVRIPGCLYRRTDGVIVKLTCPDCHRSNFSSAQGFLNHSRIAHSKEYASQDSAALRCGEVLPDEYQDEEGLSSLASLRGRNTDPSTSLNATMGYMDGLRTSTGKEGESSRLNSFSEQSNKSRRSTPDLTKNSRIADAKAEVKDLNNDGVGTEELMKKLISSGVARDAIEFESLIGEIQKEVPNSHLFADEVEAEDDIAEAENEPEKEKQPARDSGNQPSKGTDLSTKNEEITLQAGTSTVVDEANTADSVARPDVGGKYENRLRRRKSRAEMSLTSSEVQNDGGDIPKGSDDRRYKRKKAQR